MNISRIKAVGLLSGGLDSTLAAKLMLEQTIDVYAINFTSPFCTCTPKTAGCAAVVTAVKELGNISLKRVALRDEYLEIVRNPKHGYGSGMNPCIDCRIMKIKKAGDYMRKLGAAFIFTGEILSQRPMTQHKPTLNLIDRESGLQGYILRPLSAVNLEPTIPEIKDLVDRSRLLGISGRSRKMQISLATEKGIKDYPCPAGGCLLTDKNFSDRIRDYFINTKCLSIRDIPLLKVGRYFRIDRDNKVIVARNKHECKMLKSLYNKKDQMLVPLNFPGPVVILQGTSLKFAVEKMIKHTKHYVQETALITHSHNGKSQIVSIKGFYDK